MGGGGGEGGGFTVVGEGEEGERRRQSRPDSFPLFSGTDKEASIENEGGGGRRGLLPAMIRRLQLKMSGERISTEEA